MWHNLFTPSKHIASKCPLPSIFVTCAYSRKKKYPAMNETNGDKYKRCIKKEMNIYSYKRVWQVFKQNRPTVGWNQTRTELTFNGWSSRFEKDNPLHEALTCQHFHKVSCQLSVSAFLLEKNSDKLKKNFLIINAFTHLDHPP